MRWHLDLTRRDYGQYGPVPSLAARWTAPLQHIAHLLPDGFLDTIERACRPQFLALSIDAALAEVRSFGAHVYVETFDVQPLPDEPFATHLLHEARHIGVKEEVRNATVRKEKVLFSVALPRPCFRQRLHAAHLSTRQGGACALLIRQLQRAARPLHAESAQRRNRSWRRISKRTS